MNRKKKKGTFFTVLGLLLLAAALCLTAYNLWDAHRADEAAQGIVEKLEDKVEQGEIDQTREMPTVEIDGNLYIGELSVPDLALTLPVMADWDYDKLKIAPCRYSGNYYYDDLVVCAHNYARHFSPLKWLPEGTEITFINVLGERFDYTISWIETIQPEAVEEMVEKDAEAGEDWDLTLFTCNTGGQTRCAIRCMKKK